MKVELKWITPDADNVVAHIARVSNYTAKPDDPAQHLITYLLKHKHYSPFEMAGACLEIETTRTISRQIIRHRSFHFQEFSQRYSEILPDPVFSEARLQDRKNRQNSIATADEPLQKAWQKDQEDVWTAAHTAYLAALRSGVAKEVARRILPEGMVPTRLYVQGTLRDWLFYIDVRGRPSAESGVELEHQHVAVACGEILFDACPMIFGAAREAGIIP
jgi:thymidylate synthase (FAD)